MQGDTSWTRGRKSTRADATNAASVVPSVQAAVVAHAMFSVEQV